MGTPATPTRTQLDALLDNGYGLAGALSRLPGENLNYRLDAADGRRFVLKLAGEDQDEAFLTFERSVVDVLSAEGPELRLPRVVETLGGDGVATGYGGTRARLLEFVDGTPWCDAGPPSDARLRHLGEALGSLDRSLESMHLSEIDPTIAGRSHRWDLARAHQHRDKVSLVEGADRRRILEHAFHLFAAVALPRLGQLRRSVIHGDANDENLLVDGDRVVGLLDFGDCLVGPTVCELAIALAYGMLDSPDPLATGAHVVSGYLETRGLDGGEQEVLFPLVCARLAVTVSVAAERRRLDPSRGEWFVTEGPAWRLLERLADLDPVEAGRRLMAGLRSEPFADLGAPAEELLERRRRHIGPSLSLSYREPLKMVRGRGQYLYDRGGRPYLDLVNNVCHVGHCHPRVVSSGQAQMARLNTNTRYLYDGLTDYAERLCATLPSPLEVCYFVNSGSEANELALRLARARTGRHDLMVVDGAYHGHTAGLIDISPYKFMGKGGSGRAEPWVHVVPVADGYRGRHKGQGRDTGVAYGDDVGETLARLPEGVAGFISESLLGCGGQVVPPEGYFETAYRHVRAAGGVCIADEVQVGFGRVGTHFWAFERQGVVPDIVVMGKPIGNGHPMAAVVTTREIADAFANGMEFFATFGGNPVSCAIGLAVLDVIRDEGLQQHAHDVGTRFKAGLEALVDKHELIGEVRGVGLFLGVELVRDRGTLEPAAAEADEVVNRMKARGMLLSTDGPLHNVIKIKPPMVLTADDVDMVVRSLDDVLATLG
ncbi:MAG: aminotransferase class III-fold pyridoxal phosphate-dependent enzyme [Acidobacteriota bacterium]